MGGAFSTAAAWLPVAGRSVKRRTLRYKSDAIAMSKFHPPLERNRLVQPEVGKQRNETIAKGRCGEHEGEVGEGERGEIAGEEPMSRAMPMATQGLKIAVMSKAAERGRWAEGRPFHATRKCRPMDRRLRSAKDHVLPRRELVLSHLWLKFPGRRSGRACSLHREGRLTSSALSTSLPLLSDD